MSEEIIGFIEFEKDLRSSSSVPTNFPVNLTRTLNYNMILKDYDPEIYNFRTMIEYTYIIPSTAQGSISAVEQDIEVNLKVYAENKQTRESIGYFECTKLLYNITRKEIDSPLILEYILSNKYTIILNKQGLFDDIELLETKIPPNQFPPTYWGLFFNKKNIFDIVPNIEGDYLLQNKSLIIKDQTIPPTFDFNYTENKINIKQNGNFIIMQINNTSTSRPSIGYLPGVWNKITTSDGSFNWQLIISDYDDNGLHTMFIKKINNNNVLEMFGYYTESGYSITNPNQRPVAAEATIIKL